MEQQGITDDDNDKSLVGSTPECDLDSELQEPYYFESDHVALKGNPDYQNMLRTIALLEAQRVQALKDLDKLHECRDEALKDPIGFVDKLQRNVDLNLPKAQKVTQLPHIHWEKYTSNLDFPSIGIHKHMTRLKKQLVDGSSENGGMQSAQQQMMLNTTDDPNMDAGLSVVRGRIKTEAKSVTFNQLWTVEEQKRLEDLLVVYPPEEVEAKRWQKIATALGNRTPQQVASRIQKYFIKLAKAGLPVPGRMPNVNTYNTKSSHRHHRYHKFYHQPSTFLHAYDPPVYMSDDEDCKSFGDSLDSQFDNLEEPADVSDDDSIPEELRDTEEYAELMRLKRLRQEKLQQDSGGLPQHLGFQCDRCQCEPIAGTRWHCTDCPPDVAVDFCDECVDCVFENQHHNSSHRLKPVHRPDHLAFVDRDYTGFVPGDYNYLDPNYMPAS